MVTLKTLGACGEVGRSAFLVKHDSSQVLLDYGISMKGKQILPGDIIPRDLNAIVVSHAHVDHTGALPYAYISGKPPCFMMKPTRAIISILLEDSLKISEHLLPFEMVEVKKLYKSTQLINYNQRVNFKSFSFKLLDAGHIPGSALVLLNIGGKNIMYTGDLNTRDTRLLWGSKPKDIPPLDALIIESTYASTTHPPRIEVEKEFIGAVKSVLSGGGKVLIPAFGLARSQEVLSILQTYGLTKYNITIDGMARSISRILVKYPDSLRAAYSIDNIHMIHRRRSREDRKKALMQSDIIIAPSGMLKGGTVRYYAPHILQDEKNGLFLVSYQVEGTPGRILLEEGNYYADDAVDERSEAEDIAPRISIDVNAKVGKYDFSSHCDGNDLINFVKSLEFNEDNPNAQVFCVHGDRGNCEYLANLINEEVRGVQGIAPNREEQFSI
ncbi:MAG: MBL fold metallo-hydrolase [Candidatus Hodarchaeota archaeon]